jgi:hypothetical protein
MSDISVKESGHDPGALVLTISKESFGEFIRDLISEDKQIRRDIKGSFVLDREEFLDLVALVNQRVTLQNQVILSTIRLSTGYRDGYRQEFRSLEAFNSTRDARQSEVCAIQCTQSYIIKFPGREKPEKQEVSFQLRNYRAFEEYVFDRESLSLSSTMALGYAETGAAHIILEYTEVSWGYDLESLISQYLLRKFSKSNLIYQQFIILGMTIFGFCSLMVPFLYFLIASNGYLERNKLSGAASIDGNETISVADKILKKLDLAISSSGVSLSWAQIQSLVIGCFGIFLLSATLVLMLAIRKQSFLLMNEFTKQIYAKYLKRYEFIRYALITSFIVGLAGSLGASFLYDLIRH